MDTAFFLVGFYGVWRFVADENDTRGENGFWNKHVVILNDIYNDVLAVHELSLPVWIGVCQTGTHVKNYLTGQSAFLYHDKGEYELIGEDFEHLYQRLDCKISNR